MRHLTRSIGLGLLSLLGVVGGAAGMEVSPDAERRPNVILIYTDDQGSLDLNTLGSKDLHTPHIDALFASGVTLSSCYAPAPVCSPSRAGMLTGRTPMRAQLTGNVPRNHPTAGMPAQQYTIAEMLRDHGYATAHIGKWHLGHGVQVQPNAQGFDYSFGQLGGCFDNYSHFMYWSGPNSHDLVLNGEEIYHPGQYFPDLMVRYATRWIEDQGDKPFFMYFAINLPHYPYQGEPRWLERYAAEGLTTPRLEYAAFMSSMDERVGALLEFLRAQGLERDTIVIYQSDHGHSTEERAFYGGGNAGPHRGAKFSLLEGGLHVPAAIAWPGHLPAGEVRDAFTTGCDWMPTIAALTGCELPDRPLDGRDLSRVLRDPEAKTPHESFHWVWGAQWAVRSGDWKLIANANDNTDGRHPKHDKGVRLYNLANDPGETTDLSAQEPDVVRLLTEQHEAWRKHAADQ